MEPRSAERGNTNPANPNFRAAYGFNGATLSRTWKHRITGQYYRTKRSLQWSHAQPNVETSRRKARRPSNPHASMEPRSAERGNEAAEKLGVHRTRMLQWSHAQPNVETLQARPAEVSRLGASMEPRSAERGNELQGKRIYLAIPLQWSHAQPNVETNPRAASGSLA